MESSAALLVGFTAWLLRASLQGSVVIALVLLVQWLFRRTLSPRWRYALWLLVLARLLLPASLQSGFSIFNFTTVPTAEVFRADGTSSKTPAPTVEAKKAPVPTVPATSAPAPIASPVAGVADPGNPAKSAARPLPPTTATRFPWTLVLSALWLGGVLFLLARIIVIPWKLNAQLAQHETATPPAVFDILEQSKRLIGVNQVLPIVQSRAVQSPALLGFIRPWLLLPHGLIEKFSADELRFVFLHELAHLKRRDIAVNWLMTLLQILHWFNPLLWYAFVRMRADRELACDELALSFARAGENKTYGQAILKLLEAFTRPAVLPGLVGILEDKSQMQRRIIMIAQHRQMARWSTTAAALLLTLGALTLTDAQSEPTTVTPLAPGMTARLAFADKEGFYGVSSPVGNSLYRMSSRTGDVDVFDVRSRQTRRIANQGTRGSAVEFTEFQVCSRDGQQLVFDTHTDDQIAHLRIRNMNGSGNRVLCSGRERGDRVFPLDWAPDGQSILAVRKTQDRNDLVRISTADGALRTLHSAPSLHGWIGAFFSPDGRFIAIDLSTPGDPSQVDVHVMTSDGRDVAAVAGHPAYDHVLGWSPDGQTLVFESQRSGTRDIWIVPLVEGKQRGDPVLLKKGFDEKAKLLGLTADGSLCYTHRVWLGHLYHGEVDLETGKVLVAPTPVTTQYTGSLGFVQWSPDGKNLLYISQVGPGGSSERNILTIRSANMGKERFLSPSVRSIIQTSWTADSRAIVGFKIGAMGIYKIDAETSEVTQLSRDGFRAQLCPDGKALVFSWSNGIFKRNLATEEDAVIVRATQTLSYTLSPDGRWIAFVSDGVIQIVPIEGGEPRELFRGSAKSYSLNWTQDGRHVIAYAREASGLSEIWRIPVKDGTPLKLDLSVTKMTSFALHPDNRRFAFSAADANNRTELWVLENFLPKATLAAR